jgi:hypothetical protein
MAVLAAGPCPAQSRSPDHDNSRETFERDSGVSLPVVDDAKPNSSAPAVADPSPSSADDNGSEWHFDMSPYMQAGYRYLFVNYRNGGAAIQMVTSGVLVGLTFNLK